MELSSLKLKKLKFSQKKLLIFQEGTFRLPEKFLIFHEMELYSSSLNLLGLRLIFLALKDKNSWFFFKENPLGFLTTAFCFRCFHFSPLFFSCLRC